MWPIGICCSVLESDWNILTSDFFAVDIHNGATNWYLLNFAVDWLGGG